jgi:hypothetical protein
MNEFLLAAIAISVAYMAFGKSSRSAKGTSYE